MRYFVIKHADGTFTELSLEQSAERMRSMQISYMEIECMLAGIPSIRGGDEYVIVDTDKPQFTDIFFKSDPRKIPVSCTC